MLEVERCSKWKDNVAHPRGIPSAPFPRVVDRARPAIGVARRAQADVIADGSDPVAALVAEAVLTRSIRPRGRIKIQDGIVGGVEGQWLRPIKSSASANPRATILYLHGGGYCIGSPVTHRAVNSRLARATCLPVFVPDYRLAPEHPFPAALDDAVAAYRSLLQDGPIVLAGDSAGGGLALATALAARQMQIDPPIALILFSPWVNLSMAAVSPTGAKHEAIVSYSWLAACAHHYLAGADPTTPLASPIFGDLRGLPPILIQVAGDEILHGDAKRIHAALENAGVSVRCEIMPEGWHLFQITAGMLAAADAAIARAGDFISLTIASCVRSP